MIDLSRHIEYVLLSKESVFVPFLGTFRTSYVSSSWIKDEELFLPPFRAVGFVKEDKADETFCRSLAKAYNITVEEAGIICMEYHESIMEDLHENGSVEIGSIGNFILDEQTGATTFVPCMAGVANPYLYGLDSLHVSPLRLPQAAARAKVREDKVRISSIRADKDRVTISISRRVINHVASVAASFLLFAALLNPSFGNLISQGERACSNIIVPFFSELGHTGATTLSGTDGGTQGEAEKPDLADPGQTLPAEEETTPEEALLQDEYVIILAALSTQGSADRYISELTAQGMEAESHAKGKYIRVILPGFDTKEEANAKAQQLREMSKEFSGVWVDRIER